jgi:hypothetical protein
MKIKYVTDNIGRCVAAILLVASLSAQPAENDATAQFPYEIKFEVGDTEFAGGDNITVEHVRGTMPGIAVGATYLVEGTYTLASREEADLSLFATTSDPTPTPIDPGQTGRIQKGPGAFRLMKKMGTEGYLHVTFYDLQSGKGFGGVYFGEGKWVLHNKRFSFRDAPKSNSEQVNESASKPTGSADRSPDLCAYLGAPVAVPAGIDPRYQAEGLVKAVNAAAQSGGITLKNVHIEDSEFPFLVGVECEDADFRKLGDELKKLDGYEYSGSVGGHNHHAINITPWRAFPSESAQRIGRRMTLRQQILYDRISRMN